MNFKEKYFFLPEFILPFDNSNVVLNNFIIEDIQKKFEFNKYIIFPIEYSGFFNSYIFLLFNKSDKSLISEKIDEIILPLLNEGKKNLYSINFRKVNIQIKSHIEEFKISNTARYINIILEYQLNIDNDKIVFYVLIPLSFIKNLLIGIFGKNIEGERITSIREALNYFKFRLYRDSITSFWDLGNFINSLSDKDTQRLINVLLSNNMMEETMLTGLIAGFASRGTGEKIFRNLSKNLKQEIEKNLNAKFPDFRWIDECFYLIKSAIEELLLKEKLEIESLKYIIKLKEKLKEEKYRKIFSDKSFEDWIREADKKGEIENLRLVTPNKILIQSLIGTEDSVKEIIKKNLTKNAAIRFEEDLEYEKRSSGPDDVMRARIEVIENLKELYYDKEAQKLEDFEAIILSLNKLDLNLLIEECGVLEFAQATIKSSRKLKKQIYSSVTGTLRNLLSDIYSGKVRFKSAFGDQTINKHRHNILKTYLFLKGEGRIISGAGGFEPPDDGSKGRCLASLATPHLF